MLSDQDADQERAVVTLVGDVLGDDVMGIYRHGSAVNDGLRWCSDLDTLVVTDQALAPRQRQALVRGLLPPVRARTGRPAPTGGTHRRRRTRGRPWRYPPRNELQYGEWMRAEMTTDPAVTGPSLDPDLAVVLSAARQHSLALTGPPAPALLAPVPTADLQHGIAAGLPGLLAELHTDTRIVVLTLARMVVTAETGAIVSKLAPPTTSYPPLGQRTRRHGPGPRSPHRRTPRASPELGP